MRRKKWRQLGTLALTFQARGLIRKSRMEFPGREFPQIRGLTHLSVALSLRCSPVMVTAYHPNFDRRQAELLQMVGQVQATDLGNRTIKVALKQRHYLRAEGLVLDQ